MESEVAVRAAKRLFELRRDSFQDRSLQPRSELSQLSTLNSPLSTLHSQQKTSPAPKGTGDVEFLIINPVIPLSKLNDDLV